eukprot:5065443-Alexandrium_andersonii.AAC.1
MSPRRQASSRSSETASGGSSRLFSTAGKTSWSLPASPAMRRNCTTAKGGTGRLWPRICRRRARTASTLPFFRKPLMVSE